MDQFLSWTNTYIVVLSACRFHWSTLPVWDERLSVVGVTPSTLVVGDGYRGGVTRVPDALCPWRPTSLTLGDHYLKDSSNYIN